MFFFSYNEKFVIATTFCSSLMPTGESFQVSLTFCFLVTVVDAPMSTSARPEILKGEMPPGWKFRVVVVKPVLQAPND
jgi:hypothetical protein